MKREEPFSVVNVDTLLAYIAVLPFNFIKILITWCLWIKMMVKTIDFTPLKMFFP